MINSACIFERIKPSTSGELTGDREARGDEPASVLGYRWNNVRGWGVAGGSRLNSKNIHSQHELCLTHRFRVSHSLSLLSRNVLRELNAIQGLPVYPVLRTNSKGQTKKSVKRKIA